jgi:hypothetical protein
MLTLSFDAYDSTATLPTLGLIPQQRNALVVEATIAWNCTTWLNIALLAVAA